MKKLILYCCLAATILKGYGQTGRYVTLFNNDWKFHQGDIVHGEGVDLADQGWSTVKLPHDWSIEGPFGEQWASGTAFLPTGIGWYRKIFTPPASARNKKTFIYFEGVYKNSEVWINGHYLGKRPNGFISFQYELSPFLKIGKRNLLAVRVDHSSFGDSRWYTGSGIYRNVYLVSTAPVHIGLWGVGFSTPEVSVRQARIKVDVNVINESVKDVKVTVISRLVNSAGATVAEAEKLLAIKNGDTILTNLEFEVKNPQLWSVGEPHRYDLIVSLVSGTKLIDEWQEKVGIRSIRFDADNGFSLNGQSLKLKGVCIHDDAGALGVAVPKEVWRRRLEYLRQAGCNSLRMSHNPHAGYLYDLCDEMGFLVMDEAFDEWEEGKNKWIKGWNAGTPGKDGYHEYFSDWHEKDLRDMVLRDRDHPSIIMWSIGNEIDYPNDPYSDPALNTGNNPQIYGRGYLPDHPSAQRLGQLSKLLAEVVRKIDTTRPVTAALAGVVMSNMTSFPENLDVVGYNYQEYRYKDDHKTYPKRVIYGSENGMQLGAWQAVDTNSYIAGQYLWTGIDYLGEAHKWPSHGSGAGLLDLAGFPKPEYFLRQSLWSNSPMIYLGTEAIPDSTKKDPSRNRMRADPAWNFKPGDKVRVNCFTNCKETELFLNGRSLGRRLLSQFSDRVIYWDVDFEPGELMVKGYANESKVVKYTLMTSEAPYAISVSPDKYSIRDRTGLFQLMIKVVDKKGIPVYNAENEITVAIVGPAKLLGLESGALSSHEKYKSNCRKAFNGRLLAYIQQDAQRRPIQVVIRSKGLRSGLWKTSAYGN